MAFALSQIFVAPTPTSAIGQDNVPMSSYQDMLAKDAFGYYSTLLNDVTYHPDDGQVPQRLPQRRADLQRLGRHARLQQPARMRTTRAR